MSASICCSRNVFDLGVVFSLAAGEFISEMAVINLFTISMPARSSAVLEGKVVIVIINSSVGSNTKK